MRGYAVADIQGMLILWTILFFTSSYIIPSRTTSGGVPVSEVLAEGCGPNPDAAVVADRSAAVTLAMMDRICAPLLIVS